MANIFIIHGIGGHPEENWFPWLKAELERAGHRVVVPAFPHANKPVLAEWLTYVSRYEDAIGADTVMVGHSLGAAFILRWLEQTKKTIAASYLVAPVSGVMGNEFDALMTTFTLQAFNWSKIRMHCGKFQIFFSDNDSYISPSSVQILGKNLGAKPMLIKDAGHFNTAAGYTTFPKLLENIVDHS